MLLDFVFLAVLGVIALGGVGLILGIVCLVLYLRARKRGEKRQFLFLGLTILDAVLTLVGGATLLFVQRLIG